VRALLSIDLEHLLLASPTPTSGPLPHIAPSLFAYPIYYLPPNTGEGGKQERPERGVRHMNGVVNMESTSLLKFPHVEAQAIMDT